MKLVYITVPALVYLLVSNHLYAKCGGESLVEAVSPNGKFKIEPNPERGQFVIYKIDNAGKQEQSRGNLADLGGHHLKLYISNSGKYFILVRRDPGHIDSEVMGLYTSEGKEIKRIKLLDIFTEKEAKNLPGKWECHAFGFLPNEGMEIKDGYFKLVAPQGRKTGVIYTSGVVVSNVDSRLIKLAAKAKKVSSEILDAMIAKLDDDDLNVRDKIQEELTECSIFHIDELQKHLQQADSEEVKERLRIVIGEAQAVQSIIESHVHIDLQLLAELLDSEDEAKDWIYEWLRKITCQDLGRDRQKWLQWLQKSHDKLIWDREKQIYRQK